VRERRDQVVELRKDDRTFIVLECARNYLSIGALLKDHSEIDEYVEMARSQARLGDLTIGLMSITQIGSERVGRADRESELTGLDYRILNELRGDARRPVEEVAAALGVSAATARRRLARLIEIGAFNAGLDWRPSASPQIVSQVHVRLKEGADRTKVAGMLMSKNASRMLSFITFSNLPDFLLLIVWAGSMKELNDLTSKVAGEEGVASAFPNVVIAEHRFDTWIEKRVAQRAAARSRMSSASSD
jgi:DNA-binding Lrp family transcriptional regulator